MSKLSFTTMGTPEMDGFQAIQAASKYGYNGIDMRVSDYKGELTLDSSAGDIQALQRAFDSEGITPSGLLCYNETGSDEPGSWDKMQDSICRHLDIGTALGTPSIRIFGGKLKGVSDIDSTIKRTAEVVIAALERDGSQTHIVLQNHGGSFNFMQGKQIVELVASPRFGMAFSPDHCLMMNEDLDDVMASAKAISQQLYVSDVKFHNSGEEPTHEAILPGKGDVPLKQAYDAIGGKSFDGWVTFKWEKLWVQHLEEPEVALPHFLSYFDRTMS